MSMSLPSSHRLILHQILQMSSFVNDHLTVDFLLNCKSFLITGSWKDLYWNTDPFKFAFCFALFLICLCYIVQTATGNISQVDKVWSFSPCIFVWHFNVRAWGDLRLFIMGILTTLWSVGLTHQFYRKGGYGWPPWKGEEDYRWKYVRNFPFLTSRINWFLFSFLFINVFQIFLLLALSLPAYICYLNHTYQRNYSPFAFEQLNIFDFAIIALFLFFLAVRTKADQEMWEFQSEKQKLLASKKKLQGIFAKGFLDQGLFSICRHPNFLAEQGMWFCMYFFSVSCTIEFLQHKLPLVRFFADLLEAGDYLTFFLVLKVCLNWSCIGPFFLSLLFVGSTNLTEVLSASKYPEYSNFCKRVHCIIPRFQDWPKLFWGIFSKSFTAKM